MIPSIDAWVFSTLNAVPSIAGKVVYFYPNSFTTMPVIAYRSETRTSQKNYADNVNYAVDVIVEIDIYSDAGTDDSALIQAIDVALTAKLFSLQSVVPVPDPDTRLIHAHLSYGRAGLTNEDLI